MPMELQRTQLRREPLPHLLIRLHAEGVELGGLLRRMWVLRNDLFDGALMGNSLLTLAFTARSRASILARAVTRRGVSSVRPIL